MEMNCYQLAIRFKPVYKILFLIIYLIFFTVLAYGADNSANKTMLKPLSGYNFAEPSTRNMQDDDFINPGILWVEKGERLWIKKEGDDKQSCQTCHGDSNNMKGCP